MQNAKTIMENQKQQIKDLEDKLQQQVSTNEQLNAQLQDTSDEKEQVLQQLKGAKLKIDLVEAELVNARAKIVNLKAEIYQKDLQLEQSYQKVAQSLLITSNNISEDVTPETVFQGQVEETIKPSTPNSPCLTQAMAFNNFENSSDLNLIKESLLNLQVQQEKTSMIVNQLWNSINMQDQDNRNYPSDPPSSSYNPCMGLLDTGQNLTKDR